MSTQSSSSSSSARVIKLTSLSHGGGCGCKIPADILHTIIADSISVSGMENLIVGNDTSDDAAVYRLNDENVLVASTDFFMPIVDDAHDFGRIAAANAISDIYAMGAVPSFALNIVGMPVEKVPVEVISRVLAGGASVCREAGIAVIGGHSINSTEPIYGLSVIGMAHPNHIKRNSQAQAGDALILGKPLGIGVLAAAFKQGRLSVEAYKAMIMQATKLNQIGQDLGKNDAVHALTDVTGFGLLGHLSEVCSASGLGLSLNLESIPVIEAASALAREGVTTGAAERNWQSCENSVAFGCTLEAWHKIVLNDPQTNGGLLVACDNNAADDILALFQSAGFGFSTRIGTFHPDNACRIVLTSCP